MFAMLDVNWLLGAKHRTPADERAEGPLTGEPREPRGLARGLRAHQARRSAIDAPRNSTFWRAAQGGIRIASR
jgi:hypothetical protein